MSQRIGDRLSPLVFSRADRNLWEGQGAVVPGVVPQQFFWNFVKGREGRAHVGLSKCNVEEAVTCAKLVKWLQASGVPPRMITCITPYKGQKLTILKELRRMGALYDDKKNHQNPHRSKGAYQRRQRQTRGQQPQRHNYSFFQEASGGKDDDAMVVVSTVDRYQGDENDVVILSLVSSRPGNRFVALKNRFIV